MSNKWLKACSVLPALLITPALAESQIFVPAGETYDAEGVYENYVNESKIYGSGVTEVEGVLNVTNGTVFRNNKGGIGGAIGVLKGKGNLEIGQNVSFEGNTATYDGGAIGNYNGTIISKNVIFRDNHSGIGLDGSETTSDDNPIGGGAIALGIDAVLDITNGNFEGNTSAYDGGAIGTRRTLVTSEVTGFDNIAHSINIKNTSFSNNEAKGITADTKNGNFAGGNGGAIATTFKNASISDSEFVGNVAAANGGAIYNHKLVATTSGTPTGLGGILSLNNNVFKSNKANKGGAIYNDSTISLTGDTQFFENSASNTGGAIFNADSGKITEISNALFQGNKAEAYKDAKASLTEDVYAQGGAIYNRGSIGAVTGDFSNNTAHTKSETASKATANGGALALYQSTIESITGNFIGNTATAEIVGNDKDYSDEMVSDDKLVSAGGGAIHIEGKWATGDVTKIGAINGNFENNSATGDAYANGGAIYIKAGTDTDVSIDNITGNFVNNKVIATTDNTDITKTSTGGAISIKESGHDATVAINGDFIGNSVTTNQTVANGGAIYNEGDLTLNTANIYGNKAQISEEGKGKGWGGAIYNTGTLNFNAKSGMSASDRVYVKGNTATHVGGAIYNEGTLNFNNVTDDEIVQITFGGNSADYGGGAIYNKGDINTLSRVLFQGNSGGIGAVVLNSTDGTIGSIKNSTFAYNTAQTTGGAVHNKGTIDTVENVLFQGNRSNNGGAFWNGGGGEVQFENVDFISNGAVITNAEEEKNNLQGGAISNSGTISYINNSTFVGNQAGKQGGAIANALSGGKGTVLLKDVLMDSNVAGDVGGAIYNHDGIVKLSGNNTFVNNFAGGVANDIHNLGTLNITGGVTTMTGGITGDTGELTISSGATLDIGTASIQQNNINVQGTLAADLLNANSFAKISVGEDGEFSAGNGSLDFTFGAAGTYDIGVDLTSDMLANADDNALYNVSVSDGNIVVATKNVATIAKDNGLANESAAVLVGLANSGNNVMNAMAIRAQDALKEQGGAQYVQAEAKKLLPQDTPVAQSVASSAQSQVLSLAAGRMSGNALVGRSGGDAANMDYGVWAQGLMNHSKYADKFSGDTYGVAVGADALINGKYTVGIGYAYNETDIDATHDTSIDSSSLFVYGQYKPTQWYINAALNYTMANYEESGVAFGRAFDSYKYDVDSFGGQIMTGYDFASGLTPEVGARYLHIATDDYNNGFNVENEDTNYLTGVAGLKYAFEIESDARLKFRPEIRAAATYDFLSDEAVTTVTIPGASAYVLNGERLSRFGGEFGIGLSALYEGWEISVNYDLDLHEDYTSQTGMLKFRYNF